MDNALIDGIVELNRRGAAVLFGRSTYGHTKIKVRFGPLKLRTRYYKTDDETYAELKDRLRQDES